MWGVAHEKYRHWHPIGCKHWSHSWDDRHWPPHLWLAKTLQGSLQMAGGRGASTSLIKRCLSGSNPVKRGVSGRMMRNLFNEMCQQWWLLGSWEPPHSQKWPHDPGTRRIKHSWHQRADALLLMSRNDCCNKVCFHIKSKNSALTVYCSARHNKLRNFDIFIICLW